MPRLPLPPLRLPRPPVGPDPLRRVAVPRDLEPITSRADETPSGRSTSSASGTAPSASTAAACTRRSRCACAASGEVVLDRAIGHARGNGPGDDGTRRARPVTPDTPFVIFSASKAITAMVVHLLDERGLLHIDDRVVRVHPGVRAPRQGRDHDRARALAPRRRAEPPGATCSTSTTSTTASSLAARCSATPSRARARASCSPTTRSPAASSSARSSSGSPASDIREVLAEEILDPLGFRWSNYGVAPEDVDAGRPRAT